MGGQLGEILSGPFGLMAVKWPINEMGGLLGEILADFLAYR